MQRIVPLCVGLIMEADPDEWDASDFTPLDEDRDSPWLVGESVRLANIGFGIFCVYSMRVCSRNKMSLPRIEM